MLGIIVLVTMFALHVVNVILYIETGINLFGAITNNLFITSLILGVFALLWVYLKYFEKPNQKT